MDCPIQSRLQTLLRVRCFQVERNDEDDGACALRDQERSDSFKIRSVILASRLRALF